MLLALAAARRSGRRPEAHFGGLVLRPHRLILTGLFAALLCACSGEEEEFKVQLNPDGRTFFCDVCETDAAGPPPPESPHVHGVTTYCDKCKVRVPVDGHRHRENRWCDTCGVAAVWTDDVDQWVRRGHHHRVTAWCPTCKIEALRQERIAEGRPGAHHHVYTIYCPEEGCEVEVSRRMADDGITPSDPAEVSLPEHVHGKTIFCPACRVEAEKDPVTGGPSLNHFHFLTRYDNTCEVESAVKGHHHDKTRFCPVCLADVPIEPGLPAGTLTVGSTLSSSPTVIGGPELHSALTSELAEQESISAALKSALEATEEKLGIEPQPMLHDHTHPIVDHAPNQAAQDPVSRFRDYGEGDKKPTAEEENERVRKEIDRIINASQEAIARSAIKRLNNIGVRSDEEEAALAEWQRRLDEAVAAGQGQ